MKKSKPYHEAFARFFEEPTRERLREILKDNIGEFRLCDFKESLPEGSGLARHLLALANSSGGCLVIGVAEAADKTLDPVGLSSLIDKANIVNSVKAYLSGDLLSRIDVVDFAFEAAEYAKIQGKKFQVIFVDADSNQLPYIARRAGTSIRENAIYVRREGSSEEVNHEELQQILNRRLATGYSSSHELDLKSEIEQLKVLYSVVSKTYLNLGDWPSMRSVSALLGARSIPNPSYPKEEFEDFIVRMIEKKKLRICQQLGL